MTKNVYLSVFILLAALRATAASTAPPDHGFFDYLQLFLEHGLALLFVVFLVVIIWKNPGILDRISSLDVFGVKMQLKDISESVKSTQSEIGNLRSQVDKLQAGYLQSAERFDPNAPAKERDQLATGLRREAAALDDIDFVFDQLRPGQPEKQVFAAVVAIRTKPQPKFFAPLVGFLDAVTRKPDLDNVTLKTLYRLVMAIEAIVRADNFREDRELTPAARQEAVAVLEKLRKSARTQADLAVNGKKSIVPRIERTVKLLG